MSTPTRFSINQKGGIALIILILVIAFGLALGVYLVSQNTNIFSKPLSTKQMLYKTSSPAPYINTKLNSSTSSSYQNPFDESTNSGNSTNTYENPFNNL